VRVDPCARLDVVGEALDALVLDTSLLGGIVATGERGTQEAQQVADRCFEEWNDFLRTRRLV
jgi:hypothetical protein